MPSWFPLRVRSTYSALRGLPKPEQIAKRLQECSYSGAVLADHATLGGVPAYLRAMKAKSLKAVIGTEFCVCENASKDKARANAGLSFLTILACNQDGWQRLMKASSASNSPDSHHIKPRLSLEELGTFAGDSWIALAGEPFSVLADCVLLPEAYQARTREEAKACVRPDWSRRLPAEVGRLLEYFGRRNVYLATQLTDLEALPAAYFLAEAMRWVSKKLDLPCVASVDAWYVRTEDAPTSVF